MKNEKWDIIEKFEWHYRVYAVGYAWHDGKPHYTGIAYTQKKDAVKSLKYYGKGYVEAKRYIKRTKNYGGTSYCSECKIVFEL